MELGTGLGLRRGAGGGGRGAGAGARLQAREALREVRHEVDGRRLVERVRRGAALDVPRQVGLAQLQGYGGGVSEKEEPGVITR